ncbi:MAG: winged helix-turn-helix domain-containing protein [Acidimicrobiales bacterium]
MSHMRYRFDEVVLDTDRRELRVAGRVVEVQRQVFDVLVYLVENRDRVVRKEELLDTVWGSQFVTESAHHPDQGGPPGGGRRRARA